MSDKNEKEVMYLDINDLFGKNSSVVMKEVKREDVTKKDEDKKND